MAITKIILQQMVTMDQNSVTASKYPKYTIVLGNTISSITAAELTSAIESSKASAAAAKQSEINAKQSELNAKGSENEAEISAASSQQSATQSASSATASANSAKAAKTSETNAKASETAAKTSETNAKASETAAKTSETNANSSKTAAAASASAAKTSETNAAASASAAKTSETNAASSKTAAANSASAAKTSETNAAASAKTSETNAAASAQSASDSKASRDEAGTFATQATNAATAARESQTSANNSANIASQAVTTIQGLKDTAVSAASQAETSAREANTHAGAASSSAATAKTEADKAKVEADRAKAEADRASANSYTISFYGGAGWFKLATVTMPQSTSTVSIKMVGGKGYNANSPQQAGITELVLRAGNGKPKGLSGSLWRRTTEGFSSMAWINTSGDVYDVYVEIGSYADKVNIQVNYTTNASVVLHSQPEYYATKPEGLTTCTIYDLYNPLLPPPDDGTFLKKAQNLSDLPDKSQARTNLRLDRFVQATGETHVVNHAGTAQIFITDNKNWGAYDKELRRLIALPITQGGTGGLSISEAKTNLQIPSVGAGDWMEIAAPDGVEAGKYYPIVIKAQYASLYASGFFIDIQTKSSSGSDPMNCCAFNGFIRTGGWSDRKDAGYGYYNRYGSNELALKCILVSAKNAEDNIAVYVEGRAFPVKMRIPQFCTATAVTSASTYGEVTFAWGTSNPATDSVGVNTLFDFSLNRVGFYQASTEGNYYIGNGQRIVLSNGMSVGDELTLNAPKITFSGTVAAGNGFIADGTSVSNATFYSRYRVGDTVYGAEFRASENAGEIVIRDPSGGTDHKSFGFGYDGSLSLNGAIKPGSPIDISYGGTGATTAAEARQKIGRQWEETQKFLNSEAIVMLRPSASANQWIAFYREDSTTAIRLGHETNGSLSAHSYNTDGSYRKKILQIDEDATVNIFAALYSNAGINGTSALLKAPSYPRVELIASGRSGSTDVGAKVSFEIPSLAGNPPYFVQRNIHNNTNQFVNSLPSTGGVLAVQGTSGREYKKDISTADSNEALSRVTSLEMVNFVYKDDEKQRVRFGIIAEDAEKIAPQYI
ncbi:chaperone of endosialidase [Salmonella phage Kenya-K18]|nr:chaperone of endosialidase [Salmonella phage Kenya-K18]